MIQNNSWEIDKEIITDTYLELIYSNNWNLLSILKENYTKIQDILPIIEFILERFESITYLCRKGMYWDCEIILRSALETFIKYLYITIGNEDESKNKINEYWNSLAEIFSLKMSEQAKKNLELIKDNDTYTIAFLPLVLPEHEESELKKKWPKVERKKIEQKWSFSQMIATLSSIGDKKTLKIISGLTFNYRIGSHLIHGDETGIGIITERKTRISEEKSNAERGHYLRILSDILSYSTLLSIQTTTYLNLKKEAIFFIENEAKIHDIDNIISKYEGVVFKHSDYDKFRS